MDPLAKLPDPMKLFVAARGGSIFTFQRYVHANWTRVWHFVQILFFLAIVSFIEMEVEPLIIASMVYLLIFDWVVFIALGPVPAPLGTLCLALVWKFRGPAVPGVPYKLPQIGYVLAFYGIASDLQFTLLEKGVLSVHVANSSFIAFFRF